MASDDTVEYQNRIYKLSPFVRNFLADRENKLSSGAYQGAKGTFPIKVRYLMN